MQTVDLWASSKGRAAEIEKKACSQRRKVSLAQRQAKALRHDSYGEKTAPSSWFGERGGKEELASA